MKNKYKEDLFTFGQMCIRRKDPRSSWPGGNNKYYAMSGGSVVLHNNDLVQLKLDAIKHQLADEASTIIRAEAKIEKSQMMIMDGKTLYHQIHQSKVHTCGGSEGGNDEVEEA
jgi:hypothetical protein